MTACHIDVIVQPPSMMSMQVFPPPIFDVEFYSGQGMAGPPGGELAALRNYRIGATTDGSQIATLPQIPRGQVYVFINGLLQDIDSYAVASDVVSLPDTLGILIGDSIAFLFIS